MRSRIEPMEKIARTLRSHRGLILNYFRAKKQLSNGVVEGRNNKAKLTMADIQRIVDLLVSGGIRVAGEHVALVVGLFEDKVRVSHTAQIRIEEKLAQLAQQNARDRSGALSVTALRSAIDASGLGFTSEQRAAIHAHGEGGAITVLTGVAGAGKTTLLQPVVAAWRADQRYRPARRKLIGTALAWRQADDERYPVM